MKPGRQFILRFNQRCLLTAWVVVGLGVLISAQLCSTIWAFANPMPHHWDNAMYLNHAYADLWAYRNGGPVSHKAGIRGLWDSMINSDPYIPPAYRFVSAPFIFWGVRMLPLLRAISLGLFWVTLYLIYKVGTAVIDGPAGKIAGILAAMLVGLYSEIGWSIRVYGTEHTLYFSTALMLLCLARATRDVGKTHGIWIGLGLALGLGMLSKLSFVLLAGPALGVALLLILIGRLPGLSLGKLCGSMVIAAVMAWPFYHLHLREAYQYGQDMTQFQRHSLHKSGLSLLRAWVQLHINEGLGWLAALIVGELIVLVVVARVVRWMLRWGGVAGSERAVGVAEPLGGVREVYAPSGPSEYLRPGLGGIDVGTGDLLGSSGRRWSRAGFGGVNLTPAGLTILMALAQGGPLLIFQLMFSQSNNVRHMTPAYLPLTVAVSLAAASAGVLDFWWSWVVLIACATPAFAQVHRDYIPLTVQPDDVWDWEPVYQIAQQHCIRFPMIGHVGNASQFCDPAITYPWAWRGGWANSLWLWRPEDGNYDAAKLRQKLADRDLVVTAPGFHMPASGSMLADPVEADNAHNIEFADEMMHDPQWELAAKFSTGTVNPAQIWVFVKK